MKSYLKHYIDGAWVDSIGGTRHDVIDPATEQPCTEITIGTAADVDAAVTAARTAFESFSQTSVADRAALLERIVEEYKKRIPDLAQAVSSEMGAPIGFAMAAQVPAGLGHFLSTLKALNAFQFEERLGRSKVVHEPLGVVAMITPWNWPLNQIIAKVAPALAAGDTMILKPSEESPRLCGDPGRDPGRGGRTEGRLQSRQRRWSRRRRGTVDPSRCGHGQLHRIDPRGNRGRASCGSNRQTGASRTRRKGREPCAGRRGPRARSCRRRCRACWPIPGKAASHRPGCWSTPARSTKRRRSSRR